VEPFGSILGALGSIASLVSLVTLWKQGQSKALRGALLIVFVLTGLSSYLSYQYFQVTQPEAVLRAKQGALRSSIQAFLSKNAIEPSYWEPGHNEGIVKGGLIILELNKELFPDSYARIRADIEADMAFVQQHRNQEEHRLAMDAAAKNIITILRALAGGG